MKTRKSLKGIRILSSLDSAEITALNFRCYWRRVQPNEWLIHQDHVGTEAYFLVDGAMRVIISERCLPLMGNRNLRELLLSATQQSPACQLQSFDKSFMSIRR